MTAPKREDLTEKVISWKNFRILRSGFEKLNFHISSGYFGLSSGAVTKKPKTSRLRWIFHIWLEICYNVGYILCNFKDEDLRDSWGNFHCRFLNMRDNRWKQDSFFPWYPVSFMFHWTHSPIVPCPLALNPHASHTKGFPQAKFQQMISGFISRPLWSAGRVIQMIWMI